MTVAVIFDLDGTTLDNESEWEAAFVAVVKSHDMQLNGLKWMANGWIHEPGIGIGPNWKKYFPFDTDKADKLARETWQVYWQEQKKSGNIKIMPGLVELVERIKEKGWMTALCTGSNWNVVEAELEQVNLYMAFDVTTTGEEVALQKPDPEIYILTAQKLGLEPGECVVIEDAVAGVRAGVEAGCKVIALESEYASAKLLNAAGASFVVGSFEDAGQLLEGV